MGEKKYGYIIYNLLSPEISSKVYLSFRDMNLNEETNLFPAEPQGLGEMIFWEADFIVSFNTIKGKQDSR